MEDLDWVILGGGPTGLTFGRLLQLAGINRFVILEKESAPGGLCRSKKIDDLWVDIGGGHFLDARNEQAVNFLFSHLPREKWVRYRRRTSIEIEGKEIGYPIESNLWQLPFLKRIDYLWSALMAGSVRGVKEPASFQDWIRWKLGNRIAQNYMLPYNEKIWGIGLDAIGTYWLDKLPSISPKNLVLSYLTRSSRARIPAHSEFWYPREGGYGAAWKAVSNPLANHLRLGESVESIDFEQRVVNGRYRAGKILVTIPWTIIPNISQVPPQIEDACRKLFHSSIAVDLYLGRYPTVGSQWVYVPNPAVSHHRVLVMNNFGAQTDAYWTETNVKRMPHATEGIFRHCNDYAYPIATSDKRKHMSSIKTWALRHNVYCLGRWGTWEYFNSDVCISSAFSLAKQFGMDAEQLLGVNR